VERVNSMDTELADRLADLKTGLAAINGKCDTIHASQEELKGTFHRHEDEDRADFKEVHARITGVEKRQNWMLGVGASGVFVVTLVGGFFKGLFGG
jgi:hypothetical protein